MCGIAGTIGFGNKDLINKMVASLRHRGPDNQNCKQFKEPCPIFLGHTRLAILDLSEAGNQPMSTSDCRYWIVYNGECYNFGEIKRELIFRFNETFVSESDTEIVLSAFKHYGTDIFSILNGIFAFCIFDRAKKKIFLVRDHMGVKPIFYSAVRGNLIFGSEIKAILTTGQIDQTDISRESLWDFFTFLYVPSPYTIYKGIKQVPPAHFLEFDLVSRQISITRYWEPVSCASYRAVDDYQEAIFLVKNGVEDAVKSQMISDVPLGAFLSGGVDSNIIVGCMAKYSNQPVKTFTAIFGEKETTYFNEQVEAKRVSARFSTLHQEIQIPIPSTYDVLEMVEMCDQPFGNPALFLSNLISRGLTEEVTVALSGAGGDELFGGYVRYRAVLLNKYFQLFPSTAKSVLQRLLSAVPNNNSSLGISRIKKLISGFDSDFIRQYSRWTYFLGNSEKEKLFKYSFRSSFIKEKKESNALLRESFEQYPCLDLLGRVQWMDMKNYLLNDILMYTDISGMHNSLEIRVPLLDKNLVELSLRIPSRFKIQKGRTKKILVDAFKDLIPTANLSMPKRGFSLPIAHMITKMDTYFNSEFDRSGFLRENIFNESCIDLYRKQHLERKEDRSLVLFAVIVFDAWWQTYVRV